MRSLKGHQMAGAANFLIAMLWALVTQPLPRALGNDIGSFSPDGQDRHVQLIQ